MGIGILFVFPGTLEALTKREESVKAYFCKPL